MNDEFDTVEGTELEGTEEVAPEDVESGEETFEPKPEGFGRDEEIGLPKEEEAPEEEAEESEEEVA